MRQTSQAAVEQQGLRDVERWKDKIEIRLDNRQVAFLFFGSALIACLLFILGVIVGKRLESRGHALAPEIEDPLALLDRVASSLPPAASAAATRAPADVAVSRAHAAPAIQPALRQPAVAAVAIPETKPVAKVDEVSPSARKAAKLDEIAAPIAKATKVAEVSPPAARAAKVDDLAQPRKLALLEGSTSPGPKLVPVEDVIAPVPASVNRQAAKLDAVAKAAAPIAAAVTKPLAPVAVAREPVVAALTPPRPTLPVAGAPKPAAPAEQPRAASPELLPPSGLSGGAVASAVAAPVAAMAGAPGKNRFMLQVGSFLDRAEAEAFASSFASERPVVITSDVPGKGTWYRVRVGEFHAFKEAVDAKLLFERRFNKIALVVGPL